MDEKAYIEILEDCKLDDITFKSGDKLYVMFNPSTYSLEHTSKFKHFSLAKDKQPVTSYTGPNPSKITLELLFDSEYYRSADEKKTVNVLGFTQPIVALTKSDGTLNRPPYIKFAWGGDSGLRFSGVMESVSEKHQMFDSQGISTRCTLTITIITAKDITSLDRSDLNTKIVYDSASASIKDMNQRMEKMKKTEERRAKREKVSPNDDVKDILSKLG